MSLGRTSWDDELNTPMTITSFDELIAFAESVSHDFSHVVWFRGHANSNPHWTLTPSAFRRFPNLLYEQAATMNFLRRAPSRHESTPETNDRASWLCLMQHYGLPTRLLDWTESLLVAAYFAVNDPIKTDGAIYALAPMVLNALAEIPYVPMLSNVELYGRLHPAFRGTASEEDVLATLMPDVDQRMLIQQGVFTLHSSRTPLEKLPESDSFLRKAVIPVTSKERLAWQLRVCGVSQSKLFPDLGNLAEEIVQQQMNNMENINTNI